MGGGADGGGGPHAVSYTHLDVYKRQPFFSLILTDTTLAMVLSVLSLIVSALAAGFFQQADVGDLDVYKRQVEALLNTVEGDEKTGVQIIAKALEAPLRQIAANAGLDGAVILEKVRTSGKNGYGFDAYKEEYCCLLYTSRCV